MELATYIALSRLSTQQRALDVTASNLANAATPGFKASRVLTTDWLSNQVGTGAPKGDRTIAYTQDRATYREQNPGSTQHTGNPLDLAISGDGYFTVQTPRGPRLTRAGHYTLGGDGAIADMDGNKLLDTAGQPLQLSPTDSSITVTADGTITTETGTVGQIGIVQPQDPNALTAEGSRDLRADTPTTRIGEPKLVQGAVEDSNVQPILETTRMMDDLRSFQFMTQMVESESERMQSAIDKLTGRNS